MGATGYRGAFGRLAMVIESRRIRCGRLELAFLSTFSAGSDREGFCFLEESVVGARSGRVREALVAMTT